MGSTESGNAHERAIGARLLKDRALAAPAGPGAAAGDGARVRGLSRHLSRERRFLPRASTPRPWRCSAGASRQVAGARRAPCSPTRRSPPPGDYYKAATRAEALLLLGRTDEVTETLASEAVRGSGDLGGRSSTLAPARHGRRPSRHGRGRARGPARAARAAAGASIIAAICSAPTPAAEARIRGRARRGARRGGGRLRLWRARLRRRHPRRRGLARSRRRAPRRAAVRGGGFPAPVGAAGRRRAGRRATAPAATAAKSVVLASPMAYFGNPAQYGYASRTAMGLARLRAEHLAAEAVQIAIWDGSRLRRAGRAPAPTSPPGRRRASGRGSSIPGAVERGLDRPAAAA